jgi:hypothetical protein
VIHRTTRALLVSAALNAILCRPIWSDAVFLHDGTIIIGSIIWAEREGTRRAELATDSA